MKRANLRPITFYVSEADYHLLTEEAERHGVTVSYFVRELVTQYSPVKLEQKRGPGAPLGNVNAAGQKYYRKQAETPREEIYLKPNKPQE
jgi:hypothetical protein